MLLKSNEGKAIRGAFVLGENVKAFIDQHGHEFCGMLTLTIGGVDAKSGKFVPLDWRTRAGWVETQRRMNNASRRLLRELFKSWVWVREPTRKGGMHLHLVVACSVDIRTGVNFKEFEDESLPRHIRYRSAGPALREMWGTLKRRLPGLGFGRAELTPLKSTKGAVACYVGKYIGKGYVGEMRYKPGHGRRVGYSFNGRVASLQFAWNNEKTREWRGAVASFAASVGCRDLADIKARYGARWVWHLRERICEMAASGAGPAVVASDGYGEAPPPNPVVVKVCKAFGIPVPAPVFFGPDLPVWLRATASPYAGLVGVVASLNQSSLAGGCHDKG